MDLLIVKLSYAPLECGSKCDLECHLPQKVFIAGLPAAHQELVRVRIAAGSFWQSLMFGGRQLVGPFRAQHELR